MNAYEPGPGWVHGPLFPPDLKRGPIETIRHTLSRIGEEDVERVWHHQIPQPPLLPVEPYTVIRATFIDGAGLGPASAVITLIAPRQWVGAGWTFTPEGLAERILGFEVLAEPLRRADA